MKCAGLSLWLLLSFLLAGCPSYTFLSIQDQDAIQRTQVKKSYFLKQSFFYGPFFAYGDRLYLSERSFDERVLLESPGGDPILPPDAQGILPMGSQVTINGVEFPTSGAISERKLKSPRFFTWVLIEVNGKPSDKPYVLVLTPEFKTIEQFNQALQDYLVAQDPRPEFAGRPPEEIQAIDQKNVVKGMRADSLLRARGYPDRITRAFDKGVKVERWQYSPSRVIVLRDDVVVSWEGFVAPPAPEAPPSPAPAGQAP